MTELRALVHSVVPLLLSVTGSTSQCVIATDSSTGMVFIKAGPTSCSPTKPHRRCSMTGSEPR